MARKIKFPDKAVGAFRSGTFAAISRVLLEDEDRTDFFRSAVEAEIERRGGKRNPGEKLDKTPKE